jgi:hypothetical protein
MAVYVANIVIDQGCDFAINYELQDTATNQPKILVGYGITAQLRKTYSSSNYVSFASSISLPSSGLISISLTDAQTSSLKPGRYVYDVLIQANGLGSIDDRVKAVEGMALVRAGVTR